MSVSSSPVGGVYICWLVLLTSTYYIQFRRKLERMVAYVLLGALNLLLQPDDQISEGWSTPILISGSVSGLSSRPTIAVDLKNNLHIAWSQDLDGNRVKDEIYYATSSRSGWTLAKNVSKSSTPSSDPTILCIKEHIHFIWSEHLGSIDSSRPRQSPTSLYWISWYIGGKYDSPTKIFDLGRESYSGILKPSTTSDSKGGLYIVLQTPVENQQGDFGILFKSRVADTWLPTRSLARGLMPAILADDDRQLHLVYISALRQPHMNVNNVIYSRSLDGGLTWQDSSLVHFSGLSPGYYPRVFKGKNSIVHVLWLKGSKGGAFPDAVYHTFATKAGIWHSPFDATQSPGINFFNVSAVIDKQGVLHLVVEGSGKLYYSSFDGQQWLPLKPVFDRLGSYEPEITIDNLGVLHLVWTERKLNPKGIYYSRKRIKPTG